MIKETLSRVRSMLRLFVAEWPITAAVVVTGIIYFGGFYVAFNQG